VTFKGTPAKRQLFLSIVLIVAIVAIAYFVFVSP
jgi:hypothetical protein